MKIINFGLSKHLIRKDELLTDQCGSLAYVSPEILSGTSNLLESIHNHFCGVEARGKRKVNHNFGQILKILSLSCSPRNS